MLPGAACCCVNRNIEQHWAEAKPRQNKSPNDDDFSCTFTSSHPQLNIGYIYLSLQTEFQVSLSNFWPEINVGLPTQLTAIHLLS